ncbi:unnamed protein product [Adineta ricciae]|uniref:Uncharacterized protein n=1 Tax=Adineta ricciae TaxID=249248 RepID=A0A814YMJ8_ADIRI|nr:unnamed protein product [Adineta ricciae]
MREKTTADEILTDKVDQLINNEKEIKITTIQQEIKVTRHENMFTKLVLPALDDILRFFILHQYQQKWQHTRRRLRSDSKQNPCSSKQLQNRGLDLRLQEVIFLANSVKFDILILLEAGAADLQHSKQTFFDYKTYYQEGENANGGTVLLIREAIRSSLVPCAIPDVCAIDIMEEEPIRMIGVYAPVSRT